MAKYEMGYTASDTGKSMPQKGGAYGSSSMMYGGGSPHGVNYKAGIKTYGRRNPKQTRVSNNRMNKPRMTGY